MTELKLEIPAELESEFKVISKVELSIFASKLLRSKLEEIARLKRAVAKSKLTEKDVEELSDKINESLSKRYLESS